MKKLLFISLLLLSLSVNAQRVISASANETQGVSWTIGEMITETILGDAWVTQGFNQPDNRGPVNIGSIDSDLELSVYPNPVIDAFVINCNKDKVFSWQLTSMLGQRIAIGQSDVTGTLVDMAAYAPGNYLLTVMSDQEIKSIIILKK